MIQVLSYSFSILNSLLPLAFGKRFNKRNDSEMLFFLDTNQYLNATKMKYL